MKLNLGAADRRIDGFESVDIVPPADWLVNLEERWPWPDSTIEEIVAYDIAEHIGQRTFYYSDERRIPDGRIHFMNELHRVLIPRGRATIEVPSASRGAGFIQDPTHKTPWCMNSFQYFQDGTFAHQRLAAAYGISARFKVLSLNEREYQDMYETVWKITAVLEAAK